METDIPLERIEKYFSLTREALEMARAAPIAQGKEEEVHIALDMASRYLDDANHFFGKGDGINAFACLNYAHGWLDCSARLGLFIVHDDRLFTVDGR